jgi:hypothetical protein
MYQTQIEFFWPLTEQIPLDLDYTGCDTAPKLVYSTGTTVMFSEPTWTTSIAPTLTVSPIDSKGTLSIGGVNVGLEKEPSWLQKILYKALGFNWKNK